MKCDECLPLIEEYVDGELNERETGELKAHLSLCAACAEAVDELVHEQEMYARYEREVSVTPAMWHAVRERIEAEKEKPKSNALTGWRTWLAGAFGANARLRPAFAAALVLIALFITTVAVVKYLNSHQERQTVATQTEPSREVKPEDEVKPEPVREPESPKVITTDYVSPKREAVAVNSRDKRRAIAAAPVKIPESPVSPALTLEEVERTAALVAERDAMAGSVTRPSGDSETEVARHVEQAQMLLRSFKNLRVAETSHALDISYEKEQARRLLYRNITLRREAATAGNAPAEKILNALEPILLDIANLPDHPSSSEIGSIEQQMLKKEIMAALQVHSLVAQNSY
ncbi:MAG: zf-HC2 domain-containing protein [Acidobacteria bacterium]|nr:zf-HC2 domain-containing protein [Acidobacteriota bacterium]